jgi:hypothetical protein
VPYEGEFAAYKPLQRMAETERVRNLLKKAHVSVPATGGALVLKPAAPPESSSPIPLFVVAIDGSWAEVDVRNGYPGAKVGYCTVASVVLDLARMDELDENRPADPREFRKTEEASTLDAAMPGCNVVVRDHKSAVDSFREALYENFHDVVIDPDDGRSLLDTYERLLSLRAGPRIQCPYGSHLNCTNEVTIGGGLSTCPCPKKLPIYSTDALRIHERFRDNAANGESFGEVVQVWEKVLLLHLLLWFERRGILENVSRLAFVVDGPLAVFSHSAWLSPLIRDELERLNATVRTHTGRDIVILGIEKTGLFVNHFVEVDKTDTGEPYFPDRSFAMPTDEYIKKRIIYSDSNKPYGKDTYFGRKLFYKTRSGAQIVATIPMLDLNQRDTTQDSPSAFPSFPEICAILDKLVSSRYANSLAPIVSAHANAAIPLRLGTKVLEGLARALIKKT